MSFCAAHLRFTPWASPAHASSVANTSFFMSLLLSSFDRQGFFHQRGKVAGAQRDHLIVEIVLGIVQKTTARRAALAEEDIGAGPGLQHVGEVLPTHGGLV